MSGPAYLHVHTADDEAWHVLEGRLRFKFADREIDAVAGTTVFVPAGLAHTYEAIEPSRYLIILTPKIDRLIAKLLNPGRTGDLHATLEAFGAGRLLLSWHWPRRWRDRPLRPMRANAFLKACMAGGS